MWDKSRPTRRPIASVSLISLISLRTVLCAWYCPVLAVENCFKAVCCHPAWLTWWVLIAVLPLLSPTPYRLFVLFLRSTSPLLSPITSSSHALCPTFYWNVAFSQHVPSPHFLLLHWRQPYTFYFPFGIMFCTDSRDLFLAFCSCFGLLTLWFPVFVFIFPFLTPQISMLSAFFYIPLFPSSPFPIHFSLPLI